MYPDCTCIYYADKYYKISKLCCTVTHLENTDMTTTFYQEGSIGQIKLVSPPPPLTHTHILSPVYTIQVLHPSLHSRKLEFKFVYTRCKKFWWIHTSFGRRYNKQNGISGRRGGCFPLYCINMYNCTAKEIMLQKEVNMGS